MVLRARATTLSGVLAHAIGIAARGAGGDVVPRAGTAAFATCLSIFAAQAPIAASVQGRNVDSAKATPLPGATVTASGASATAGPDGEFSLGIVPDGPVTVTVTVTVNYIGYDATTIDLASDSAEPAVMALTSNVAPNYFASAEPNKFAASVC